MGSSAFLIIIFIIIQTIHSRLFRKVFPAFCHNLEFSIEMQLLAFFPHRRASHTLSLSLSVCNSLLKAFPLWWVRVIIILMASQSDANSPNGEARDGEVGVRTKLDLHFCSRKMWRAEGRGCCVCVRACIWVPACVCLSCSCVYLSAFYIFLLSLSLFLSLLSDLKSFYFRCSHFESLKIKIHHSHPMLLLIISVTIDE